MNDNRRPEEIERDIERTRAEVSATIDAIQSKLTPGQLMDQAIGYLRTSLPADFGRNLSEAARNNPIPVALIGIGIAWMAISGRQGSMGRAQYAPPPDLSGLADTEDSGPSLTERAREASGRARDTVSRTMQGARDTAHRVTDRSRRTVEQARSSVSHLVEEQPLVLGALGVALGAALGAAMPRTEQEDEWLGDTRDRLMDRAADSAHGLAERATEETRSAMRSAASKAGE
jgi:hypothetical protein